MARKSALLQKAKITPEERVVKRAQRRLEKSLGVVDSLNIQPRSYSPMRLKSFDPITDNQSRFWDSYDDGEQAILLYGSAGTGKTFMSLYKAICDVKEGNYHKIIIVRSTVQGRDMGFLPGDQDEKLSPFEDPYREIFSQVYGSKDAYDKMVDNGKVEFVSTSFMRGTTFRDAVVVADEIQNMNWGEISTLITRLGEGCRIVMCGDFAQNDLTKNSKDVSGLGNLMHVTDFMPEFVRIRFYPEDIVRSSLVKSFIMACEKAGV
jgi:phosphate starvation-inducible protein PhoH